MRPEGLQVPKGLWVAPRGGGLDAPNLVGQYLAYVVTQLHAFADGTRRNDIFGRMRTIAAKLTDQEITELSAYYNARH
jgi:cytochrome c553